ncbi:hypothetical protein BSBH6_03790 [Bacillus subtilis]|nr:hypothetical protein BSBH6_03790 [Bacillus subtilis]RPK20609.1 hypothetical protein BH5_03826 [Bacillus subtilis]
MRISSIHCDSEVNNHCYLLLKEIHELATSKYMVNNKK